jgi:hypothetical protein
VVVSLHFNVVEGDGASRVANAGYVTFSRDPHLGAIGFVWNPLPSLVEIPLLQFSHVWDALKTRAQAGTIQSALFMAAAVLGLRRIAYDRAMPTIWRMILVGAFALNPMIVIFGGNGLSEAAEIMCLVLAARYLMLWLETSHSRDLAPAGIWLGVGYLVRYDVLAATAGAAVLVAGWTMIRMSREPIRKRLSVAAHDWLITIAPTVVAVVVWALSGWLLVGVWFAQISSQYGNSAIVDVASQSGAGLPSTRSDLVQIANAVLGMEPLIIVLIAAATVVGLWRRDASALAPLTIFVAVLCFQAAAHLSGATFGFFRFYITVIPLAAVVAATLWTPHAPRHARASARLSRWSIGVVATLAMVVAVPVTWQSMLNPAVGNQASQYGLRAIFDRQAQSRDQNPLYLSFQDDRQIAAYLDSQHLPRGSVLTDTFQSWAIWLASQDPEQFVITSDKDFFDALNAPERSGIQYILVSNPRLDGYQDAVNKRYPTIWEDGAKIATLVLRVTGPGDFERWRIYRVSSTTT